MDEDEEEYEGVVNEDEGEEYEDEGGEGGEEREEGVGLNKLFVNGKLSSKNCLIFSEVFSPPFCFCFLFFFGSNRWRRCVFMFLFVCLFNCCIYYFRTSLAFLMFSFHKKGKQI